MILILLAILFSYLIEVDIFYKIIMNTILHLINIKRFDLIVKYLPYVLRPSV